jgi:hypothetical protein
MAWFLDKTFLSAYTGLGTSGRATDLLYLRKPTAMYLRQAYWPLPEVSHWPTPDADLLTWLIVLYLR